MDYKSILFEGSTKISKSYSLKEAWNSKKMNEIREIHHSGNRQELNPCDKCPIKPEKK